MSAPAIAALSESLRLKGFYPAGGAEIADAVQAAIAIKTPGRLLVPINNWAAFGGSKLNTTGALTVTFALHGLATGSIVRLAVRAARAQAVVHLDLRLVGIGGEGAAQVFPGGTFGLGDLVCGQEKVGGDGRTIASNPCRIFSMQRWNQKNMCWRLWI